MIRLIFDNELIKSWLVIGAARSRFRLSFDFDRIHETCVNLLKSEDSNFRSFAAELLEGMFVPIESKEAQQCRDSLLEALRRETDNGVRVHLIEALSIKYDERQIPLLIELATSQNVEVRRAVASALTSDLSSGPSREVIETLVRLANDHNENVVESAVMSLEHLVFVGLQVDELKPDARSLQTAIDCLKSKGITVEDIDDNDMGSNENISERSDISLRERIENISLYGDELTKLCFDETLFNETIEACAEVLSAGSRETDKAVMILQNLRLPNDDKRVRQCVEILRSALFKEQSEMLLSNIAFALWLHGDNRSIDWFRDNVAHPDPVLRELAAQWIPAFCEWNLEQEDMSALKRLLNDESQTVRSAAAFSLACSYIETKKSGRKQAADNLIQLCLTDQSPEMQSVAEQLNEKLRRIERVPALIRAAQGN